MSDAPDVAWTKGGGADVATLDGERITVRSTIPSAPGSRIDGTLAGGGALRVKVARCRRQDDGFVIDGRLIDTTREVRVRIEQIVAGRAVGSGGRTEG